MLKNKITMGESAEEVEKGKTTINMVMYFRDEVTDPDEAHGECGVQLFCW